MRTLLVPVAVLAATLTAGSAYAGPSAGLLVGNGFKDGYNIGIGVRAGFTIPVTPLYIGGTFVYHLGKTVTTPLGDATSKLFYLGAEGGYEAGAGPIVLRPYLGLGYASFNTDIGSTGTSKFALWPGLTALVQLVGFFVGVDGRYVIITDANDFNAFALFATAGLTF
jgi:hypothetical protein